MHRMGRRRRRALLADGELVERVLGRQRSVQDSQGHERVQSRQLVLGRHGQARASMKLAGDGREHSRFPFRLLRVDFLFFYIYVRRNVFIIVYRARVVRTCRRTLCDFASGLLKKKTPC